MLVAICGSQGSGKSTTLKELKLLGFNVVERKTSRSILEDWNITLEQVNNDQELTYKFQDKITKRKVEDESIYGECDELWFTERTHADLFVYSLASIGKNNDASEWLNSYYETCKSNNHAYDFVFQLPGGKFEVEHDGVRGSNTHYSQNIEMLMNKYQREMFHKLHKVYSADPTTRALEILTNIYQEMYLVSKKMDHNREPIVVGEPVDERVHSLC